MIAPWILLALFLVVFGTGIGMMIHISCRRPIPDPTDPEQLANSQWKQYADVIGPNCRWLEAQPMEPLEVVSFDNKRLYGRFYPCENARGTILMFHGYRSSYAVDFSGAFKFYRSQGLNLLLVDQRAHGKSQGRFITFGVRERYDVLSWVTYLSMMLGEDHPMYLTGLSMGATSVLMASDLEFPANIRGIIADCGFTSPGDIIRHLMPHYHLPPKAATAFVSFFTRLFAGFGMEEWSTAQALANTTLPVIFFHGLSDHFVPWTMSEESYAACASPKQLVEIPGAGHGISYLIDGETYRRELQAFLDRTWEDAT